MATLPALQGASPIDISDNSRLLFSNDVTANVFRDLDDMPSDFVTMDTLLFQVEYRISGTVIDDTYKLQILIREKATPSNTLADVNGTGIVQTVVSSVTNTTDQTTSVIAFGDTNVTATKAVWDDAEIRLRTEYVEGGGSGDGLHIEIDWAELTGTYTSTSGKILGRTIDIDFPTNTVTINSGV